MTRTRLPGEVCWINMLTPEPARAREFFAGLLGWTFGESPGMGHLIKVDGTNVGGLFDVSGPNTPAGTEPMIGVMVKVTSADATAKKVKALGGMTKPTMDIRDNGRLVVCRDPNGAEFDLWQPKKQVDMLVDGTVHGAPSWFETITTDVAGATKFYSSLFGWAPHVTKLPDGRDYTDFNLDATPVAGLLAIRPDMGKVSPHWDTYFTVDDVDAALKNAQGLGGKIYMPPMDVPDIGRMCGITSPQGVTFYVITYDIKAP